MSGVRQQDEVSALAGTPVVRAAGAVVWREPAAGLEVALVHRPHYDDWSLPKGKLDRHETIPAAAVREVAEETGYRVVLGRRVDEVRYFVSTVSARKAGPAAGGQVLKSVEYFAAEAVGGDFAPNDEVDELRWLAPDQAAELLSYPHDREVLARFTAVPARTTTLLLVRHAKAGKRENWAGDDDLRPLTPAGRQQAEALRHLVPLWNPQRVHSAPRVRCVQTIQAVADDLGTKVFEEPLLAEEGYWVDPEAGIGRIRELLRGEGPAVVCSQGGVIPDVVERLAVAAGVELDEVPSKKGSTWVLSFEDSPNGPKRLVAADYIPDPLP